MTYSKKPIKQRMTTQRQTILEVLKNTTSHPTADWVYQEARKILPNVSLGTIYRNLGLLRDSGAILELTYGDSHCRYDGNPQPHYHFHCLQCGQVFDLPLTFQDHLQELATKVSGHTILEHRLEFTGICRECASESQS